jgi:hypothetical protein
MRTWILVLIGAFSIGVGITAGQTAPPTPPATKSMMSSQQTMMAGMRDANKKLDELVQQLNAAQGNERIDRLVAVVNELVAERRHMSEMMTMHAGMMQPAATTDEHSSHHQEQK